MNIGIGVAGGGWGGGVSELLDPRYQLMNQLNPNTQIQQEASRRGISVPQLLGERQASAAQSKYTGQGLQKPAHLQKPDPSTIGSLRPITFGGSAGPTPIAGVYGKTTPGFGATYNGSNGGAMLTPTTNGSLQQMISGSGFPDSLQALLNLQAQEDEKARAWNIGEYTQAKDNLLGVLPRAKKDPLFNQGRNLASVLAGDPEAINDRIQNLIRNKTMTQLEGNSKAQMDQTMGQLANEGKLTSSAMARAQGRLNNANRATLASTMSDLEVQRAIRRNQDYTNVSDLAARRAGELSGLDAGMASTMLQNLAPMYPRDYSSLAAVLGLGQAAAGGLGGGGSFGYNFLGGTRNLGQPDSAPTTTLSWERGGLSPGQPGYAGAGQQFYRGGMPIGTKSTYDAQSYNNALQYAPEPDWFGGQNYWGGVPGIWNYGESAQKPAEAFPSYDSLW